MALLRVLLLLVAVVGVVLVAQTAAQAAERNERPRVLAVEFENDVNPVTQDYLTDAIEQAEREGYAAVVLVTDTPGGLDTSMRAIIKKELDARVPVVVYVAPPGARAASAGVFLAMAADVAAMAPQTNIGSSTPISASGEEIPADLRRKVVNDAATFLHELAEEHGRNAEWAEDAVRKASNLGAREALDENVVDVVASDLPSLLDEIDGMRTRPKGLVLDTGGAEVDTIEMSFWKRVLDTFVDPNLILVLMSIGVLGITVEVLNPGLVFPGTIGAISLVVGLFGLQILPISWAGVLLLLLAVAFFAAEAFVTSHGALALAGTVSFVVGALFLFDPAGDAYDVSVWVALAIGGTLALVLGVALTKVVEVRRTRPQTGEEELVGNVGIVRQPLDPTGYVFVHGELWRARSDGEPIAAGERVRVERIEDGLVLAVRRADVPEPVGA
ncbi:MAG: nodulation protein NfeD [Thermoleophilia bacterium]|nr:nodulation protein NfeD [Thermoleophilia bacterium]